MYAFGGKADIGRMLRNNSFGILAHSLPAVTALYDQFFGDSGRLHRSLRCHFVFMSASAGYPRFFKASSTPSMTAFECAHFLEP
jgi:hypothetical protein